VLAVRTRLLIICVESGVKLYSNQPTNQACSFAVDKVMIKESYYTHSLFHSRLKSFLFCKSSLPQPFLFLTQVSLYGFSRLFTVTSEHIRLFTF